MPINWAMMFRNMVAFALSGMLVFIVTGCTSPGEPETASGISWNLAKQRAQIISMIRYDLAFTIPAEKNQRIHGQETILFDVNDTSKPLVIDFKEPPESISSVSVAGKKIDHQVMNGHIVVPGESLRQGENIISIDFLAGDGPLNREQDYLYTLFVPDRASATFPCFDQPNLKARFNLTLDVPASWRAVANGELLSHEMNHDRAVFKFAETKPISTYLFAFAAGDFKVETAQRGGQRMQMYHRETDAEKVARNEEAIFDLHETALNWLEEYTGIKYPFGQFDFVLIPSFQFSGMEHPGAILYRASSLLLDESATQTQKLNRASVIAHETAHMWFGDWVTMNWFDDVWTKEVLANFMAAKIANPLFPEINHDLRFFLMHYPGAYDVDRTEGANPIRQPLDNLNEASSLYGAIIYLKAPIVMRQLEMLVGETAFRDGLREYLTAHPFGNATWPDLIEILHRRSSQDLKSWSHVWVEESGRPKIKTELSLNPDGTMASLTLRQSDPQSRGRWWSQRLDVLLAGPDQMRAFPIKINGESVVIQDAVGLPKPNFVLTSGRGLGYGRFELDPASQQFLLEHLPSIPDELTRAAAWVTLWEAMLEAQVSPSAMIDLAARTLPVENVELTVQRIVEDLTSAYWRFIPASERTRLAPRLEELLWTQMENAPATSMKSTYFRAFSSIVMTEAGLRKLERVWRNDLVVSHLPFSEQDYMSMALALAVREVPGWAGILNEQLGRIQDPEREARFAFVMPAVSADPSVRDVFFQSLSSVENRRHEPWVLEALTDLHHPLRAGPSEKYLRPSLDLVEEIQRTGGIFFPKGWLDATLSGHNSEQAAARVREFLADHPNYPSRLKGKILQAADGLFRAAAVLSRRKRNE